MMKDEGMAAGAAQYEEAYGGQGNTRGAGHALMNAGGSNTAQPRKMNYGNTAAAPTGQYPDGGDADGE